MICSQCKKEGKKSKVYPGVGMVTAMYCPPFYDEDGRFHNHDGNITTQEYACSNGHKWAAEVSSSCWCGWGTVDKKTEDGHGER